MLLKRAIIVVSGDANWQKTATALRPPRGAVSGRLGQAFRLLLGGLVVAWLLFAAVVLVLRYQVLPDIARYRDQIEQLASRAVGLPVRIGGVSAGWAGLRPELFLDGVRLLDQEGREALSFRRVEAVLSWRSLAFRELRLHRLVAEGPTVRSERLADGRIFVAGFQVHPSPESDSALADWVLHQDEIRVVGARVDWRDGLRQPAPEGGEAPLLRLDEVNLRLENSGRQHRFALQAVPPAALAGRVELRGELEGDSLRRLSDWRGRFYLAAPSLDFARWLPWFDLPVKLSQGRGGMRLWGRLDGGPAEISADLALAGVRVQLGAAGEAETPLPELALAHFQGRLGWRRDGAKHEVTGQDLSLALSDGLALPPSGFHLQWTPLDPAQGGGSSGLLALTEIDLGHLARLSTYLPLDRNSRQTLQDYAPEGELRNLKLLWRGNAERLQNFSLSVDFAALGMRPNGLLPGFENLSGHLVADEGKGQLEIDSSPLVLHFPAVFPQPRIPLDELKARVGWTTAGGLLDVRLQEASFAGPDAAGGGSGSYRLALNDQAPGEYQLPGQLELKAQVTDADATAVWRYLPHLIAADVRDWVRDAVRGGRVRSANLVLRGPLAAFPFPNNQGGQFLVTAKVNDGRLHYAPGWPEIGGLETELRFEGAGASFAAQQAVTAGVKLGKVQAAIADFAAASPRLVIDGEAQGPVPGFLRFLDQSPLGEMLGRFYEDIRLDGEGKLRLGLDIPLDDPEAARVRGDFDLAAASALVDPLLPPVLGLAGRVSFTEKNAQANALAGQIFGRPLRVDLRAEGNEVRVAAFGEATAEALQGQYPSPLLGALSGTLPWQAAVSVRDGRLGFAVQSSLEGLASDLPEPFGKKAASTLPIRFSRTALPEAAAAARPGRRVKPAELPRDQLRLEIGEVGGATLIRRLDPAGAVIERGIVAVGDDWAAVPVGERGLRVVVKQPQLDLDRWRSAWSGPPAPGAAVSGNPLEGVNWPTPQFDLRAKTVRLFSRQWHEVKVQAVPVRGGVTGRIEARDMAGEWSWDTAGQGTLRARLSQLVLPEAGAAGEAAASTEGPQDLPALDVLAEQLVLGERRLGKLEIRAENAAGRWQVPRFQLSSPEGTISGRGVWTPAGREPPATEVDFEIEAADFGKLLTRFGYPDALRRGQGKLAGRLNWQGAPTALHLPTLNGTLDLQAERGQFNKLEPGIGKLLSLMSLQMLPRRITLDFRDVFSEGFAFENIRGNVAVGKGVLATENLVIEGPAAKVLMKGNADLARDRTSVRVTVQPELGSSVAIGAAVAVNPAVGVATLLAQKLLRDPFNKVFAFEYEISGALSDPQIRKIGGPPPGAPAPAAPPVPGGTP